MRITNNRSILSACLLLVYLFIYGSVGHPGVCAEEYPIRHELRTGIRWFNEHTNYRHYVSAGESNPQKSESFEKDPFSVTGTYTLFLSPLVPRLNTPTALWGFYERPTKAGLSATFQPEARMTNIHTDPALGYQRHTITDESLRTLAIFGEHYVLPNTGISANFATFRNDDNSRTRSSARETQSERTGKNEGLRRTYGVGVSHYLAENLNLRVDYNRMDGAYRSRDRDRNDKNPMFDTRHYTDSELTGNHLSVEGTSVINTFLGLQVGYDFQNYVLEADYVSVFPGGESIQYYVPDFPKDESIQYEDELAQHTFSLQLNLYPGSKTWLWWRGSYADETIQRTYTDFSQTVDFARRQLQLHLGVEYDINHIFSIEGGYGYLRQYGDIRIAEDREPVPMATYDTNRERHTLTLSVISRF